MTDQAALGFTGNQAVGQQPAQPVSPEGGAQAGGAQAQFVTLDDAKRMVQEAVDAAIRQAQSHTDKSVAHLTEQIAGKAGGASPSTQQQSTPAEGISPERIEWANREAQRIYTMLGETLTAEEADGPYRALLDESSPEAFIKSLPAAVMAKRIAAQGGTQVEAPTNPAARAPALSSGGTPTRSEPKYSDIPDLIGRGLNQALPRKR